jgi:hypothetical protein
MQSEKRCLIKPSWELKGHLEKSLQKLQKLLPYIKAIIAGGPRGIYRIFCSYGNAFQY